MADVSEAHLSLGRQIMQLAARERLEAGYHFAEKRWAARLSVSRTPLRATLRLLADMGVVDLIRGSGFFLTQPVTPGLLRNLDWPSSRTDELYHQVTHDRFGNTLPMTVTVVELCRRYDASRTEINRVLNRLVEEGLISRESGHGWHFAPVLNSPEIYQESYRFRACIESQALLEQGFQLDRTLFAESRRLHEELLSGLIEYCDSSYLFEVDAGFHEMLAQCSGNRFFCQAIIQQNRLRRISEYEHYSNRARMKASCQEHLAILTAIEAGHMGEAAEKLHRHISMSESSQVQMAVALG